MKKIISLLFCGLLIAITLIACGEEGESAQTKGSTTITNETEYDTEEEVGTISVEDTEETTGNESAYLPIQGDAPFEYIEYSSLSEQFLGYVPVLSIGIVVCASVNIYNTETGEFLRTVDLLAKEDEDGYGDLNLGENEAIVTYNIIQLSKESEETVNNTLGVNYQPGEIMDFQREATLGLGYQYASVDTENLGNFLAEDTEENIAEKLAYLTENGYQTKITLQTEIVPQFN